MKTILFITLTLIKLPLIITMIVLIIKILSSSKLKKNDIRKKNAIICFISLIILTGIEFIVAFI